MWCRRVVQRLAEPAPVQLKYLRELGVEGSIDELVLEFDDVWSPLAPLLASEADRPLRESLLRLNEAFKSHDLSWSPAALSASDSWQRVRNKAADALIELDAILVDDEASHG